MSLFIVISFISANKINEKDNMKKSIHISLQEISFAGFRADPAYGLRCPSADFSKRGIISYKIRLYVLIKEYY